MKAGKKFCYGVFWVKQLQFVKGKEEPSKIERAQHRTFVSLPNALALRKRFSLAVLFTVLPRVHHFFPYRLAPYRLACVNVSAIN